MKYHGKDAEEMVCLCDLCSKEVSLTALVSVATRDIQKAVRDGFNPFETPGINMPDPETLFPGHNPSPEEMYEIWRERTMIDSTVDYWYLCPDCDRAPKGQ